jgi:hypothetical protein
MSFKEGQIPTFESLELNLSDPSRDPLVVINKTNQALELRLQEVGQTDPIDQYLEEYTIPFLTEAKSMADRKDAPILIDANGLSLNRGEIVEIDDEEQLRKQVAFELSAMIVGLIPNYLELSLPEGTSYVKRPPSLARPYSTKQVSEQLDEVHRVISLTMNGAFDTLHLEKKPASVLRTQAFFIVGSTIPRMNRNHLQYDKKQMQEEVWKRYLENIQAKIGVEDSSDDTDLHDGYALNPERVKEIRAFTDLVEGIEFDL